MIIELTPTAAAAAAQLAAVRTELELQRSFRTEQLEEVQVGAAEAFGDGDTARLRVSRLLIIAAETALQEIDAALGRLDDGTYGTCERCDQPIPIERLEVLPTSRSCTPCQARAESSLVRRAVQESWPVAGPARPATNTSSQ